MRPASNQSIRVRSKHSICFQSNYIRFYLGTITSMIMMMLTRKPWNMHWSMILNAYSVANSIFDFQKFKNINVSGFVISEALEYVSRGFGVWKDLGGPGPRGPEISRPHFTISRDLDISRVVKEESLHRPFDNFRGDLSGPVDER